ncbi:tyrosine-type recombinase/integrase [Vibrio sp. ER1A]|uniref:tyrosine-type recombinase/integrase n=1 Tax=Vibrio sp. ER1A TaxID=1517681 RepID=UPI0004DCD1CC|nr:site-specific integrase [Vibrio sp. ER1A]KFA99424.1 site-specific recombinase [Vibrio sp. ER1A]
MNKIRLTTSFIDQVALTGRVQEFFDEVVPALYLRVYPSGKKSFYIRYQHDGIRVHRKLGNINELSLSEARKQVRDEVNHTRYLKDIEDLPNITLSVFSEEFFRRYPRHWKPRTLKKNESAFRLHIAPMLGERPVHTLERSDIERWFGQLTRIKGTANQALVLLSVMMKQCELWGYRHPNTNPCRHFKRYKEEGKTRYLDAYELRSLWRALNKFENIHPVVVMVIRLLIYTGCRSSEVRLLQWKDYRGGHWHLPDSKTGAKTVYLCSQVRAYLEAWSSKGEYLFHGEDSAKPLSSNQLTAAWAIIRKEAKLDDVRLHDLRHTYASIALQSKVNLLVLSRLLGHAEPETTLKYAHLSRTDIHQAASCVSGVLAKGMRS